MSRSIGGVYSLPPGSAAVDNTIIDPVIYNALLADLEADLNLPRPIVAGGTGAASADGALTALGGGTTGKAVFTAADVAAALVALGLTNASVPAGQIGHFFRASAPAGWLWANGAAVSRTTYATLWSAMGSPNTGDGSTTFTLPDLRGEFLRGWDNGRGVDAGRVLGSAQAAAMLNHTHGGTTNPDGVHAHGISDPGHTHTYAEYGGNSGSGDGEAYDAGGFRMRTFNRTTNSGATGISINNSVAHTHAFTSGEPSAGGGAETRPRNVAMLACIKT